MKRGSGVLAESGGSLVHSSFSMLNGGAVYGFAISPSCYWVRCVVRSVKPATYSYEYHTCQVSSNCTYVPLWFWNVRTSTTKP